VSVVGVVGNGGSDVAVAVASGVGDYYYWQATAVAKPPVVAGQIVGGVMLQLQYAKSDLMRLAERWRWELCDEWRW